jgi:hypothetical protein
VTGLHAFGISPTTIVLEWREMAGERGYRIERAANGADFEPIGTAPAHACGYRDTGIKPGGQYSYRIATIEPGNRISYSAPVTALSGVAELVATPLPAKSSGETPQVLLEWKAPSHAARLFVERELRGGNSFVTVGSVDGSETRFVDRLPIMGKEVRYRVAAVQDVSELSEAESGVISSVGLPDSLLNSDSFALRLTGKLTIEKRGVYSFFLISDDGSRMFLDGALVVDNDGPHTQRMVSGTLELAAGEHELEVQYYDQGGHKALELAWSGPGIPFPSSPTSFSRVPASALSPLTYQTYRGRWQRLPFAKVCALSAPVAIKLTVPQANVRAAAKDANSP